MSRRLIILGVIALAIIGGSIIGIHSLSNQEEVKHMQQPGGPAISSTQFKEGEVIPVEFTCKGQSTNPPLQLSSIPPKTKSLVLIMHDPDAVSNDFTHWLLWNISPDTASIAVNSVPAGAVQGANGAGQAKYYPPCPPKGTGTHHYFFELYALKTTLDLKDGSSRQELEKAMRPHVISTGTLTGLVIAD